MPISYSDPRLTAEALRRRRKPRKPAPLPDVSALREAVDLARSRLIANPQPIRGPSFGGDVIDLDRSGDAWIVSFAGRSFGPHTYEHALCTYEALGSLSRSEVRS